MDKVLKMKSSLKFIPILWLVTAVLAEPPVGDGYPSARSSHDHHHHDDHHHDHQNHAHEHADQRSLSQEYGVPDFESTRNAPEGYEYNSPNGRSNTPSEEYNAPNGRNSNAPSDGYDYSTPSGRSAPNESYNAPNGRSNTPSASYNTPNARSNSPTDGYDYNAPSGRSNSRSRFPPATVRVSFNQRFKPASRSADKPSTRQSQRGTPASSTRTPVSAKTLSTEYGMPDARSTPSQEYGVPVLSARTSNFNDARSNSNSDVPSTRSGSYEAPKPFSARNAPSEKYGVPSSRSANNASTRRSDSEVVDSVSQTYGAPNQKEVSETYGVPAARSQSQEYGTPSTRSNSMAHDDSSNAAASSRPSPSSTYLPASRGASSQQSGVPSEQYGAPSQQYGAPAQRNANGYDYSRDNELEEAKRARALEELEKQRPASYDFGYEISEQASRSDFGHTESREADKTQGSYFVVRPDGTKQTVDYEADQDGFRPRISVEPAETARSGGYDHNAQDIARSADGPY